jgi:molybdate transport system regulatory protein
MIEDTSGRGEAIIVEGDREFTADDAALLAAVHEEGSVAGAASALGRSRARALSRIDSLEAAFGDLVTRQRGGDGGGGSRLTDAGRQLFDRYERLEAALAATARVPETVLRGEVVGVDGELATVATPVGELRGLHDGLDVGDSAQARLGADEITVHDAERGVEPDATSARNQLRGSIAAIESGETIRIVHVAASGASFQAIVTEESAQRLALTDGDEVVLTWKATATTLVAETG